LKNIYLIRLESQPLRSWMSEHLATCKVLLLFLLHTVLWL